MTLSEDVSAGALGTVGSTMVGEVWSLEAEAGSAVEGASEGAEGEAVSVEDVSATVGSTGEIGSAGLVELVTAVFSSGIITFLLFILA